MEMIREQYRVRGYQEVCAPNIFNLNLWKTSGHYTAYKENMFAWKIEGQGFGIKGGVGMGRLAQDLAGDLSGVPTTLA